MNTPPKSGCSPAAIRSTPMTFSASSRHHLPHTREQFDPIIEEEVKGKHWRTGADDFLRALCPDPINQDAVQKIVEDPETKRLLKTYESFCFLGKEEDLYEPFASLANQVTARYEALSSSPLARPVYVRAQANTYAKGTPSYHGGNPLDKTESSRKVDLMAVSLDEFEAILPSPSTSAPDYHKVKPIEEWTRTLLCIEIKTDKVSRNVDTAKTPASAAVPHLSAATPPCKATSAPIAGDVFFDSESCPKRKLSSPPQSPVELRTLRRRLAACQPVTQVPEPYLKQLQQDETQLLSYALEVICAVGDRSHVFGLLVKDMTASMWYYDRSGVVSSQSFDLAANLDTFIRFIVAFSVISHCEIGILDQIRKPAPTHKGPRRLVKSQIILDSKDPTVAGPTVTLGKVLDRRFGLIGRGTVVHCASLTNSPNDDEVVVKIAWQPTGRKAEWDFVQHALDKGFPEKYMVKIHGSTRGPKLSEGFRSRIPGMLPGHYEDRELQVMVSEKLRMAVELPNHEFLYAMNCIRYVIERLDQVGIYHRDISSGNCGWAVRPGGGVGLLFDFDHAHCIEEPHTASQHITGTITSAAIDLLQDDTPSHLLRFEYESLMWVALWGAVCYDKDGRERPWKKGKHPLRSWYTGAVGAIRAAKRAILGEYGLPLYDKIRLEDLDPLINLLTLIEDGRHRVSKMQAGRKGPFNHDTQEWVTYCGYVTSDTVRGVMNNGTWGTVIVDDVPESS